MSNYNLLGYFRRNRTQNSTSLHEGVSGQGRMRRESSPDRNTYRERITTGPSERFT
jgi:hypothetical protein